ncbi:MAG: hypothetical protein AzoDbin1_05113 [Azoarcus sp.]|nr:hypothetical protein [Azoarcus sp.]
MSGRGRTGGDTSAAAVYPRGIALLDGFQNHSDYTVAGATASTVSPLDAGRGGRVQVVCAPGSTTTMTATRTQARDFYGDGMGVVAAMFDIHGMNSGLGLRLGTTEFSTYADNAANPLWRKGRIWRAWNVSTPGFTSDFPTLGAATVNAPLQTQLFCQLGGNTGVTSCVFGPVYMRAAGTPTIMLTFDDWLSSQYAIVFPILQRYGLVGTWYCPKNYVGTAGHMTLAQGMEIANAGNAIGVDSTPDDSATELVDQATVIAELNIGREFVTSSGLARDGSENHGCWTYGIWSEAACLAAEAAGMVTMRNTQAFCQHDVFGIGDQWMTCASASGGISGVGSTALTLIAKLDEAEARGSSYGFHFHDFVETGAATTSQNRAAFESFCAELSTRVKAGRMANMTRPQWAREVKKRAPPLIQL